MNATDIATAIREQIPGLVDLLGSTPDTGNRARWARHLTVEVVNAHLILVGVHRHAAAPVKESQNLATMLIDSAEGFEGRIDNYGAGVALTLT